MANEVLYGFVSLRDRFDESIDNVGVEVVYNAIAETLAEHNRQLNAVSSLFVERTTDFKKRFKAAAISRLQPLDENGRALPIRAAGYSDLEWPIQMAGSAMGDNWLARKRMTVGDVNRITSSNLIGDIRWMRDHILSALFFDAGAVPTPWTFPDEDNGDLSIVGLASGDATTYGILNGAELPATDDHYLSQANIIQDADDPFPAIRTELLEHPENGGDVIAFIPAGNRSQVEGLADFIENTRPELRLGSAATELIATLGTPIPGEVIGFHTSGVWLAEWQALPTNYVVAVATQGDRPVRQRDDVLAELQGFNLVGERADHPWYERQFVRMAGFGGWNRVGAVVQQVADAGAAYNAPADYAPPMP